MIISKLYAYLAGIVMFIIGIASLYFVGKKSGKSEIISETNEKVIKNVTEVKKATSNISDDKRNELRNKYRR